MKAEKLPREFSTTVFSAAPSQFSSRHNISPVDEVAYRIHPEAFYKELQPGEVQDAKT
jgi:hypothetical protein